MNRLVAAGLLALLLAAPAAAQTVTGLSGWSLYLDPGHSGTNENVGIYGYSEPQKVLRVGLALREMLLTRTDIDTVYLSRTSDADQVGLSQRSDEANALGADFFHSIHSNAGGASTNNTLMLYGGWRLNGQTVEKTPTGGGRMGDEYIDALTGAMRIPTIGNYADRTFYQGFPDTHQNQWPYLSVNRRTTMASVLSEGGFHTNPTQNTRNMNADWKRLEAQAHYWAILDWHGVDRSVHRIATGFISDVESGRTLNGATVTIDGQTYTTDTYESLFNQYSNDPDQLSNGFYYLEDLGPGTHAVTVEADGYGTFSGQITMEDTTFSFLDVALLSTVPPTVVATTPEDDATNVPIVDNLTLTFSRPMDRVSTEAAFSLTPDGGSAVAGTFSWSADSYRLTFNPTDDLVAETVHTLAIAATAEGEAGDGLDGDGDGVAGDAFTVAFTSGFPDASAPRLVATLPALNSLDVAVRPVITVAFDEAVDEATLAGRVVLETAGGADAPGRYQAATVGEQTALSFAPDENLLPDAPYRFRILPGVEDLFQNATTSPYTVSFRTGTMAMDATVIESFEDASLARWWLPQQSGSTEGIVTDSTDRRGTTQANLLSGSGAMAIDYGWDTAASDHLIRVCFDGCNSSVVRFDGTATLQAYVFGDGNGTLFRFAVDDASSIEVSPWVAVDWIGWRAVTWDLAADGAGSWIGNGVFDGALTFESLQLGYASGSPAFGTLIVDDLQLVQSVVVDDEASPVAAAPLLVEAPRPNPARQMASLPIRLGTSAHLTVRVFNALGQEVAVLADAPHTAGLHTVEWDARTVAPGVYLIRAETSRHAATQRVTVVR